MKQRATTAAQALRARVEAALKAGNHVRYEPGQSGWPVTPPLAGYTLRNAPDGAIEIAHLPLRPAHWPGDVLQAAMELTKYERTLKAAGCRVEWAERSKTLNKQYQTHGTYRVLLVTKPS